MHELPSADPSLLPAMREQGGELGRQFVDVFVGFRLRFHDEREAFQFSRHFRFASPRSALRDEGGGVVWVGFHGWAFDAGDAQMQAALAVRHSAIKAKVRHIPAATEAELRPTDRLLTDVPKARKERDDLLAKVDEQVPHMYDTRRTALAGASPARRQIGAGGVAATPAPAPAPGSAAPRAASSPVGAAPPQGHATSKAPPGFAPGAGTTAAPKRRRLFGR
ncbi:MAG TPA: hypothetical protein VFG42_05370 [Baekduia sp.]|uniref:hypothetical protein n=1 Tax=Baekduia sp. TaxID=2600305 RepID=UPI002D773DA0|nr:hypothetical protein [Baekduia sp.]HET6506196.1 hypothetical protein [Baekduia sp.]